MENCTATHPTWLEVVSSEWGVGATGALALLSTFASLGLLSLLTVASYCFRCVRGHDVITECRIGRAVVTLSVDSTGNGLHAARKLVFDANARQVGLQATGEADSPDVPAPAAAPDRAGSPIKKARRVLSSINVATPTKTSPE
jgi:hypothetical protein